MRVTPVSPNRQPLQICFDLHFPGNRHPLRKFNDSFRLQNIVLKKQLCVHHGCFIVFSCEIPIRRGQWRDFALKSIDRTEHSDIAARFRIDDLTSRENIDRKL